MKQAKENSEKESIIYGRKGLAELLRLAPERLTQVWLGKEAKIPQALLESLEAALPPERILRKTKEELNEKSDEGVHQGVLALIEPRAELSFKEFLSSRKGKVNADSPVIIVLDQVTDPHNFGAILRVADAAAVDAVLYTSARSSGVTAVVRKASAGASEFVTLVKLKNLQQALLQLKEIGYWVVGTEVHGTSTPLYGAELPTPIAIVFGREGEGLRELTIKHCDMLVHLPMLGAVESLNVNQAASIVLYELLRQASLRAG